MRVVQGDLAFVREPLISPFGFKGGYVSALWQIGVRLADGCHTALGLGVQSVLWSDAAVFAGHTQAGGNCAMLLLTEYALGRTVGQPIESPQAWMDRLAEETHGYAEKLLGRVTRTFALNALTPLDLALWQLYARAGGIASFDALIEPFAPSLGARQRRLAAIPLVPYGMPPEAVEALLREGAGILKIKLGVDRNGDQDAMLAWDIRRLEAIHALCGAYRTDVTEDGHIAYYLDINGRYAHRGQLESLLDAAASMGALAHIVLVEEPFDEANAQEVGDLPVRVAADESIHGLAQARMRVDQGYGALALKPIAKTLSETLRIAEWAVRRRVPCFCADLTVPPLMVDWNKNLAARLAPLPGMRVGVLESNGAQNYARWAAMRARHPLPDAPWSTPRQGCYVLDDDFYARSGGVFMDAPAQAAYFGWQEAL